MRAGQWERALAMAARWPRLGVEREAIQRAASALLSPVFYRAIGEDPAALIENGKAALRRRYAAYLGEDDERKG